MDSGSASRSSWRRWRWRLAGLWVLGVVGLAIWATLTGPRLVLSLPDRAVPLGIHWTPSGRERMVGAMAIWPSGEAGVSWWQVGLRGRSRVICTGGGMPLYGPVLDRAGELFAYGAGSEGGVHIRNLRTGHEVIVPGLDKAAPVAWSPGSRWLAVVRGELGEPEPVATLQPGGRSSQSLVREPIQDILLVEYPSLRLARLTDNGASGEICGRARWRGATSPTTTA